MRNNHRLIIFLTGFVALIFEICWVRQATLIFGVSVYAYSIVLTAYMGGLAIGNFIFGKRADKTQNPSKLFIFLLFSLSLTGLLTHFLLGNLSKIYTNLTLFLPDGKLGLNMIRIILSWSAMTLPSIFIGGMMPVMTSLFAKRDGDIGYDVGWVYVFNTLGSVIGTGMTAIILIRWIGLQETIFLGAGINVLNALFIFWLVRNKKFVVLDQVKSRKKQKPIAIKSKNEALFSNFLLIAYAVSGFAALGYEIVWARIISLHTVGAIYSFSIMLTVFLTGLTVGSRIGTRLLQGRRVGIRHFSFLEIGIGVLALFALPAFSQIYRLSIESTLGGYSIPAQIFFEALLSFITLFPVTVLIGMVFPVVSSLYTMERAKKIGSGIGRLISVNTVGSILGTLVAGFILIPVFGLQRTTFILAILNILIGVIGLWIFSTQKRNHQVISVGILVVVILLGGFIPSQKYLGYWENARGQLLFYEEGVESTVAVFDAGQTNPKFSTVNGRVEVPTDVLSMRAFYLLGHLPALLNPDAESALMLSFGNGIASGALSTHDITSIEVVELAPEMIMAAEVYSSENRNILDYPGLTIHVEDARNYLLQSDQKFDIITTDATHPANSSSWTLFTSEFYKGIQSHLEKDGVFLQWVPIHSISIKDYLSVIKTFQKTFPNATMWYTGGSHTLLLSTPEQITHEILRNKLSSLDGSSFAQQDLGSIDKITRHWIMTSDQLREFSENGEIVYDNNAFFMPINAEMEELIQIIQLAAIRANQ
jgi:spermidine synthase